MFQIPNNPTKIPLGDILTPEGGIMGIEISRMVGGYGQYMEFTLPPGTVDVRDNVPRLLFESGACINVNMTDGVRYRVDRDHPYGTLEDGDGSPFYPRPPGLIRAYLTDGTSRLCINPVNAFGNRDWSIPVGHEYVIGPKAFTVPKSGIFVLSGGSLNVEGQVLQATAFIAAKTHDLNLTAEAGTYGLVYWIL